MGFEPHCVTKDVKTGKFVLLSLALGINELCRGHISCDALRDELATSFAYICIHPAAAYQPYCDGTAVALGNLGIAGRHRRF